GIRDRNVTGVQTCALTAANLCNRAILPIVINKLVCLMIKFPKSYSTITTCSSVSVPTPPDSGFGFIFCENPRVESKLEPWRSPGEARRFANGTRVLVHQTA